MGKGKNHVKTPTASAGKSGGNKGEFTLKRVKGEFQLTFESTSKSSNPALTRMYPPKSFVSIR